ncbi:MAG: glycosyltransferase [Chloroflexi bacterium]|nr:glycosyltransferase [Chloroflexota bacterium]
MKIALVHDWLNQIGGAEDVLEVLVHKYPQSPIFTSIFAPDQMPERYRQWDIRALWIDNLPIIHRRHQPYLPLYPLAWNGLHLKEFDVVLSNKSGFCHGLQFDASTVHICYCLAPTRYVWQLDNYLAGEGLGKPTEILIRPLVKLMRRWDYAAAQRVSHFIAISSAIKRRIKTFYDRESSIIFPPVDTSRFQPALEKEIEDYFLVVSRLIPYKRIDLAIQAASELGLPLKIAGRGRDLERLKSLASDNVEFLGYVPDKDLPRLMSRCRAFLFPGLEDFGITTVQAQSAGRPVIAFKGGGALDTVLPGLTGEVFDSMNVHSLKSVMARFDAGAYDPAKIRRHALKFDTGVFSRKITAFVEQAWHAHQNGKDFTWQDPIL